MLYWIAQSFGILATVCCIIGPFFKKKWQMLLNVGVCNAFMFFNLLFLGANEGNLFLNATAMILNIVSQLQVVSSFLHIKKDTPVTAIENIIFLVLYVALGAVSFHRLMDLLPIAGSIFYMLTTFQRDEQKTRFLVLINAGILLVYFALLGSTTAIAELMAVITSAIALIKYRKKA